MPRSTKWHQWITVAALSVYVVMLLFIISRQSGSPTRSTEILCIGIMENTANPARLNPQLLDLCGQVGVTP
jgi:hypothetical protein